MKNTKLSFLGFGTMNGKDGKPFKTREGGVMRLENLIRDIDEEMYHKIMDNHEIDRGGSKSDRQDRRPFRHQIRRSFQPGQSKDYVFDLDRFTSFEGNTGPYILYTIVRIKSILNKYQQAGNSLEGISIHKAANDSEKALMLEVSRFNSVMENAFEEIAPHKICSYIYDLANAFNRFYHETKILSEENEEQKASWIALLRLTRDVLEKCIDVLGFSAPERM